MEINQRQTAVPETRFPDGFRILRGKQEFLTYREHSSIRIWPSQVSSHYDTHMHSAVEIMMVRKGKAVYQFPDGRYEVTEGQILMIPSGVTHSLTETDDIDRHLFLFEPGPILSMWDSGNIRKMMSKTIYLRASSELRSEITEVLNRVIESYVQKKMLWNSLCYSHLLEMYSILANGDPTLIQEEEQEAQRYIDSPLLNSAMIFMDEHFPEDISLEDVATFAGFSKSYFSRTFKAFTGVSFTEYLTQKRLDAAINELIYTTRPIGEVARKTGFGGITTFNRIFHQRCNCTPTQFRNMYGSQEVKKHQLPYDDAQTDNHMAREA